MNRKGVTRMNINKIAVFTLILATASSAFGGPYAPAAGQSGSTAIYMVDDGIVAWATGYTGLIYGSNVDDTWKTPEKALGQAEGTSTDIVCLGRGGTITLTFDTAITNGSGWDFAVFENSITDTFLELAYVEVSSDGVNFFRFDNDSRTSSSVGSFSSVDPTNIDGYAGKYMQGYGTPFDLEDFKGVSALLDVNNILYVRIFDIVGDGTFTDTSGDVIYDPYPTVGSAGFDLEAVGVIHQIPEPATIVLLAIGGIVATLRRHRT